MILFEFGSGRCLFEIVYWSHDVIHDDYVFQLSHVQIEISLLISLSIPFRLKMLFLNSLFRLCTIL